MLRDLKGLAELWLVPWAERFRTLLLEMNDWKQSDMASGETAPQGCGETALEMFSAAWDTLIAEGSRELAQMQATDFGCTEFRRMLNRLSEYKQSYMLFLVRYEVPFTNNLAERDLRHCKTKQKVSGQFRSWAAVQNYAKLWSIIATARRRDENVLAAIA